MAQTGQQVNDMHVHEGNSVAAWVSVTVMMVGALLGAVAVSAKSIGLGVVAGVVIVVGLVLGKVLQVAGYGIKKH
jgi:hypothetical protein